MGRWLNCLLSALLLAASPAGAQVPPPASDLRIYAGLHAAAHFARHDAAGAR